MSTDNGNFDPGSRTFGLVYEEKPEEFYLDRSERKPRIGDAILLEDGREGRVENIGGGYLFLGHNNAESDTAPDGEDFQVPIDANYKIKLPRTTYPVLDLVDQVAGTDSKPPQILIQGENLHALKLLTFSYAKKIDCIYIDPPYNTGATGWKYNNNYVQTTDAFRHSKWLSFMDHRLRLAKVLLNPENSCLIVAIDETERDKLGLLLERVFPDARIQMASVITGGGNDPAVGFNKSVEYLFFVMLGAATPQKLPDGSKKSPWIPLQRSGNNSLRSDRPKEFYPVFVSTQKPYRVVGVGDPLPLDEDPAVADVAIPDGAEAVWPGRHKKTGPFLCWYCASDTLRNFYLKNGLVRIKGRPGAFSISIFSKPIFEEILTGKLPNRIVGHEKDGSIVVNPPDIGTARLPNLNWTNSDYYTSVGTKLVDELTGKSKAFPYPKSLYAVEDAIRFFVANKPNALVLDFFAGSGTTGHAVMRLNKQDGGKRVCISVTNNENGICDEVTFPRLKAAITGKRPDGSEIEDAYKGRDESPIKEGFEENLEYFKLRYVAKEDAELGRALPGILPCLWMASRSKELLTPGEIEKCREEPYMLFDSFGLLTNYGFASEFADRISDDVNMKLIAVSTFDGERYQWLASRFPGVCYQLPEAYLHSIEMNGGI